MNANSEYEKMSSKLKDVFKNEADFNIANKLTWVATEKIHGANFRFIYRDRKLLFGKRKELLNFKDDFFGFQSVVGKLEGRVLSLFEKLSLDLGNEEFVIYDELFGGTYPHPDVQSNAEVEAVQTGIYYSPNIEFYAFDMAFWDKSSKKTYLDYQLARQYFEEFKIPYTRPIFSGKLDEILNLTLRIETKIPAELKLPPIPDNVIEGIVVKPVKEIHGFTARPILKLKNPEFEETKEFHQAKKWSFVPNASLLSQDLDFLIDDLRNYVTMNRLHSALSKVGRYSSDVRIANALVEEFLNDAFDDFNRDNSNIISELNNQQYHWIRDRITADIWNLIKHYV